MMFSRRLILMRHATAGSSGNGRDIDRPLATSGIEEATRVGVRLAGQGFRPNHVLCSPARRCRESWAQLALTIAPDEPGSAAEVEVEIDPLLYNASAEGIVGAIEGVVEPPATPFILLVIAHNPGISQLAYALGRGDPDQEGRLRPGFAPAATAIFEIHGPWSTVASRGAELISFERP